VRNSGTVPQFPRANKGNGPSATGFVRISCSAALTEGNDVRLSSRKAACSSMAPPSSTGKSGFPGFPAARHSPRATMCGFLRGKPHAVRWHHQAPQEIRVSRISCSAALTEGNDVRLSSRKAACSSMAPPSSTGNPGSVYTNCETAVALRLITAKRPLIMMRNKRTMRTKLLLVTTTSHGSWSG